MAVPGVAEVADVMDELTSLLLLFDMDSLDDFIYFPACRQGTESKTACFARGEFVKQHSSGYKNTVFIQIDAHVLVELLKSTPCIIKFLIHKKG